MYKVTQSLPARDLAIISIYRLESILVRDGLASPGYLLNTVDNGRRPRRGADKPAAAATDAISASNMLLSVRVGFSVQLSANFRQRILTVGGTGK